MLQFHFLSKVHFASMCYESDSLVSQALTDG